MDFLDPRKKRANLIRLYTGYILVAIAIAMGTLVLLFASYGYGLDRNTGQVIQNGLLFVSSTPGDADVRVARSDGFEPETTKTDSRLALPADQYTVRLSKDGYRTWQRSVTLEGGSIERLVYPFLFPNELKTTSQQTYSARPSLMTGSPDRRWIVVGKPGDVTTFDVFDTNDDKKAPVTIKLLAGVLVNRPTSTLELVEWSSNNNHLLLKHSFEGQFEFILVNRETAAESVNINSAFSIRPDKVILRDKSPDQLYVYTAAGGSLQAANLKERKLTALLQEVLDFKSHGEDMLLYVSGSGSAASGKASLRLRTEATEYTVRELPINSPYHLDIARFDSRWYIVAGAESENQVYVYRDPLEILKRPDSKSAVIARTLRIDRPQKVSFSGNARFIAVQSGQQMLVYDAETDRQHRYATKELIQESIPASWMDGHRLTAVSKSAKIVVFDFDGTNTQLLSSIVDGHKPEFNRNYEQLYALTPSMDPLKAGQYVFERTALRVTN